MPVEVARNGLRTLAVGSGDTDPLVAARTRRSSRTSGEGDSAGHPGLSACSSQGYPVAKVGCRCGATAVAARPGAPRRWRRVERDRVVACPGSRRRSGGGAPKADAVNGSDATPADAGDSPPPPTMLLLAVIARAALLLLADAPGAVRAGGSAAAAANAAANASARPRPQRRRRAPPRPAAPRLRWQEARSADSPGGDPPSGGRPAHPHRPLHRLQHPRPHPAEGSDESRPNRAGAVLLTAPRGAGLHLPPDLVSPFRPVRRAMRV